METKLVELKLFDSIPELNAKEDYLREMLKQYVCSVEFIKVNGEYRIMPCTLIESYLPFEKITESPIERKLKPGIISVWCTDKNEWRSLKVENVKKISAYTN